MTSQITLVVTEEGDRAFMKAGSEAAVLVHGREICSFGSGEWRDGQNARETMESGGKWISCSVSMDSPLVMDRKRVMKHLETMTCLEKAVPMKDLLLAMEEAGEASSFLLSNALCA